LQQIVFTVVLNFLETADSAKLVLQWKDFAIITSLSTIQGGS